MDNGHDYPKGAHKLLSDTDRLSYLVRNQNIQTYFALPVRVYSLFLRPARLKCDDVITEIKHHLSMTIQSYTHIVTTTEIDEIKSLGYQLSGLSGQEADFINKHFPNFDIYKLLKEVDDLFSPVSQRPTEKMLILDANSLCLQFYYVTDDYEDAATGLTFARSISLSNGEVTINNDFLDCLRLPVGKE